MEFTDEAIEYRRSIIEPPDESTNIYNLRCNKSPFLVGYYERKLLAWFKLAMGFHFSESAELLMGVKPLVAAYNTLTTRLEPHMHRAFERVGANPHFDSQELMLGLVRAHGAQGMGKQELALAANKHMDKKAREEMVELWVSTNTVRFDGNRFYAK